MYGYDVTDVNQSTDPTALCVNTAEVDRQITRILVQTSPRSERLDAGAETRGSNGGLDDGAF